MLDNNDWGDKEQGGKT